MGAETWGGSQSRTRRGQLPGARKVVHAERSAESHAGVSGHILRDFVGHKICGRLDLVHFPVLCGFGFSLKERHI